MSESHSTGSTTKSNKKRKRLAASCNPCRQSKQRCNRALPCAGCITRGAPDLCVWDEDAAPPLYDVRATMDETESLKREVERLRGLVEVLTAGNNSNSSGSGDHLALPPTSRMSRSTSHSASASESIESPSRTGSSSSDVPPRKPPMLDRPDSDLSAHDLPLQLGKLAAKGFMPILKQEGSGPSSQLVQEAQHLFEEMSPSHSVPLSAFPFNTTHSSVQRIMTHLPSPDFAELVAQQYFLHTDWYLHPIPPFIFRQHVAQIWEANAQGSTADPFSLALAYVIWGIGLFCMTPKSLARHGVDLGPDGSKEEIVSKWLELASSSLAAGHFLERPTLESIRALLLLSLHFVVMSPGDNGGTGITYLTLAMQSCIQLRLHRDPDRSPGRFGPSESEDRRRLFWITFFADQAACTTYGRRSSMIHLSDIDTRIPQDVEDENMQGTPTGADTVMSSLIIRMELAKLADRISETVAGVKPVAYSQILDFDRQLNDFEANLPEHYRYSSLNNYNHKSDPLRALRTFTIQLTLRQERLRLHRPFFARAYSPDKREVYTQSRISSLATAEKVLNIYSDPLFRASTTPWAGLCFKAVQAAIILCLDILHRPTGPDSRAHRALVEKALQSFDLHSSISDLSRRGSKVLRFLLSKAFGSSRPTSSSSFPMPPSHMPYTSQSAAQHPSDTQRRFTGTSSSVQSHISTQSSAVGEYRGMPGPAFTTEDYGDPTSSRFEALVSSPEFAAELSCFDMGALAYGVEGPQVSALPEDSARTPWLSGGAKGEPPLGPVDEQEYYHFAHV